MNVFLRSDSRTEHVFSTAIERAENAAMQADVIAALSLDVLKGTTRAYDAGNSPRRLFSPAYSFRKMWANIPEIHLREQKKECVFHSGPLCPAA